MIDFEELETAVVQLDAHNHIERINAAGEQCLAVNRDRIRGCHLGDVPGIGGEVIEALRATREEGRNRRLHECAMAGGQYDCSIQLLSEDRVLMEFRNQDWNRQQYQLQQLEVQTGLLDLLRRNLGHEIRNPLGGIRGAAQMIADEMEDEELGDLARMIMREVDRIDELIKSFWQPEINQEAFDIHQALEEVIQVTQSEPLGALDVRRDYDPSIPLIRGDRAAIRQVFMNLVRNAGQSGASNLVTRTRIEHDSALLKAERSTAVRVDFLDDGEGVPERLRPLLFLPMVTGRRDGTGLGLALAQQIAADHGGLMSYEALEKGSRFTLRLPAGEVQDG